MKAIHINAEDRMVVATEVNSLEDMQALVKGYIELVPWRIGHGNCLFVNEEGRLNGFEHAFSIAGCPFPHFVGNGFLLGPTDEEGDSTDVTVSVEEIAAKTSFFRAIHQDKNIQWEVSPL